ncbi:DUF3304 domain-containing protein [Pantoea sp. BRR-3P]|uniref:DUF3304 domain-containing protein n=1 Tax=Pantoea sp. BRR-3P TaxID=3141541 RepID=UPI0031F5A6AD
MKLKPSVGIAGVLLLTAFFQPAFAGTIEAVNHTKWAINHFSVNGQSGLDAIGPFQGGGGGCCYQSPSAWKPGLTVHVEWETGIAFASDAPEIPRPKPPVNHGQPKKIWEQEARTYNNDLAAWFQKIKLLNKTHSTVVQLPPYTSSEKTCGITVHFFPCDQVKVTTSCAGYGSPAYPINEPVNMKEPAVCPK